MRLFHVAACLALLLVGAEVAARLVLGTPALSVADPEIEYMLRPDQDVSRFGNRVFINAYGMRSEPLDPQPASDRARILFLGDSVLNGGNLTDQSELATSLLDGRKLRDGRRVEAMHVSAGSWGPGNMLAYVERFGLFGAEFAVVVLSSHDIRDDRSYSPLDPQAFPTEPPKLALVEFANRYLQRYSPIRWSEKVAERPPVQGDARAALPKLLQRFRDAGVPFCVVLHSETDEFDQAGLAPGLREIARVAERLGGATVDARRFLRPPQDYRDGVHLTASGQRGLAHAVEACPGIPLAPDG